MTLLPALNTANAKNPKNEKGSDEFVVVLDPGHGGKDIGATDNGAREKDINLAVALKVGELIKKKLKNTRVIFTRDDDTFVSLQGRADIANKNKADIFISIHTNSVDKSNKNRRNVAGTSVYALGLHKDDNNMNVARRENSVIEMEGDYRQKYSGFDPSRDESYIIFEMAQKRNLAQSIKFANEVQRNMVSDAGRKDRGVHQAGFWVLWATSMPSVLIELDFICNPQSAEYMTSKSGVDRMANAIFKAISDYEAKYHSGKSVRAAAGNSFRQDRSVEEIMAESRSSGVIKDDNGAKAEQKSKKSVKRNEGETVVAKAATVGREAKDKSHSVTDNGADRRRNAPRGARRRRSQRAAAQAAARSYDKGEIALLTETEGTVIFENDRQPSGDLAADTDKEDKKNKHKKDKKKKDKKKKKEAKHKAKSIRDSRHRLATVYTIQIMSSDSQLSGSHPGFQGLSPIYAFRENNLYKYTYGEASSREEIEPLLKKVREKIPDAFIITKTRSK